MLSLSKHALMAELVDALVSNTSGFTSLPVRFRLRVQNWTPRKIYWGVHVFLVMPYFTLHLKF